MTIHWGEIKASLSEAQNHRCAYCGVETMLSTPAGAPCRPWNIATVEHIEPKSFGGSNDPDNLVMACLACNESRQSMGVWYFLELVRRWLKMGNGVPSADVSSFREFVRARLNAKRARRDAERLSRIAPATQNDGANA